MRRTFAWLMLSLFALLTLVPAQTAQAAGPKVYVLRIDEQQMIDQSLAQITERVFAEAEADPAAVAVAMIIDTPGGLVNAATKMKTTILNSRLTSVAYVTNMATSAGALIATSATKLYMHPGSTIGAAEARNMATGEEADYKTMSQWITDFRSAAEARDRDPDLAQAMVDRKKRFDWQTTELLVLTSEQAVSRRYANGEAQNLLDALKQAGIENPELVEMKIKWSDQLGRILTTPWVAILLLVAGVIAISLEFMKPGLTVPGLVGVLSLGLFFLGNVLVGTAGWVELSLAVLGVLLLVIEAFIPGFGVFGAGGIIAVVASIFLAVPTPEMATTYLMWTSIAFAFALFAIVRAVSRRGLGKLLTLQSREKGWVPSRADLSHLMGVQGKTLTVLRPAGTAQFGNEKIDVVTEGEFLAAGCQVKVIRVEGTRVVVRYVD